MAWHLSDDDHDEIAATFADFGGYGSTALWDETCERGRAYEDRGSYMREARAQQLPEAQRWREAEKARRRENVAAKARDAARKRVERNPALVQPVDDRRGQRAWGFASAVRGGRRCA